MPMNADDVTVWEFSKCFEVGEPRRRLIDKAIEAGHIERNKMMRDAFPDLERLDASVDWRRGFA